MITLIRKKWRNISSSTRNIIIRELCKCQEFRLVILLVITIYIEVLVLFESLISVFGLFITFGIVV